MVKTAQPLLLDIGGSISNTLMCHIRTRERHCIHKTETAITTAFRGSWVPLGDSERRKASRQRETFAYLIPNPWDDDEEHGGTVISSED